jgi:hypothetical protein
LKEKYKLLVLIETMNNKKFLTSGRSPVTFLDTGRRPAPETAIIGVRDNDFLKHNL